jgi:hypothetical protein
MIQYKKCTSQCKQISKTIYRIDHHSDICNVKTASLGEISSLCRSTAAAVLEMTTWQGLLVAWSGNANLPIKKHEVK